MVRFERKEENMDKIILKTVNLTKYFGGIKAIDDLNIEVFRGELLGIIGPNGAGKTTLFNLITGFIKPTRGKIIFEGKEIQGLPPFKIALMGIARTFQIVRNLKEATVLENVLTACGYNKYSGFNFLEGWEKEKYLKKALEIIEEVGLKEELDKPAKALPIGHLRRLEIARALAMNPMLILLDEVVSGMSLSEIEEIKSLIRKLRTKNLTIILVEHNVPFAMELSDRIYVLDFGKLIAEGKPEEVARDKRVIEAYLGERYVT